MKGAPAAAVNVREWKLVTSFKWCMHKTCFEVFEPNVIISQLWMDTMTQVATFIVIAMMIQLHYNELSLDYIALVVSAIIWYTHSLLLNRVLMKEREWSDNHKVCCKIMLPFAFWTKRKGLLFLTQWLLYIHNFEPWRHNDYTHYGILWYIVASNINVICTTLVDHVIRVYFTCSLCNPREHLWHTWILQILRSSAGTEITIRVVHYALGVIFIVRGYAHRAICSFSQLFQVPRQNQRLLRWGSNML